MYYDFALYFFKQGNEQKSLGYLEKALSLGFKDMVKMKNDFPGNLLRKLPAGYKHPIKALFLPAIFQCINPLNHYLSNTLFLMAIIQNNNAMNKILTRFLLSVVVCLVPFILIAQSQTDSTSLMRVLMNDGNEFIGHLISQDSSILILKTEKLGDSDLQQKGHYQNYPYKA